MSEYLAKRLKEILPYIELDTVDYNTQISLNCDLHGTYKKNVFKIVYNNNMKCQECSRLSKNKKLSDIGKTKIGPKNNFYGHKQSKETLDRIKKTNLLRYGCEYPQSTIPIRKKISETVKSDRCQQKIKQTNLEKYGVERATQSQLVKDKISNTAKRKRLNKICNNKDVINNSRRTYTGNANSFELKLIDICEHNYNGKIIAHNRSAIKLELDIYIPELKLAIEFNGSYWHSIEKGVAKDYHIKKSILCRDKGIRLIHIYDFEDFNEQCKLLEDLLNNIDNYDKNDFNKNNLCNTIPKPYPIKTIKGTVYTAGKIGGTINEYYKMVTSDSTNE